MRTAKSKKKQDAYHGGPEAADRFENSMHKILSVSKERLLELENGGKPKGKRKRPSRNGLSG
jgi:hypothetical protein